MAFLSLIGKKVFFTLHNENLADDIIDGKMGFFRYISLKLTFKRLHKIICVNQRTADTLASVGIPEETFSVIPAFLPQEKLEPETISKETSDFVENHSPVLTGYVSKIYLYNGHDRYGGDMMIDLAGRLKKDFPEVGVILVIPNPDDENKKKIEDYNKTIRELDIVDNVHICTRELDLTALFQKSDVHIRPSNTDGDPIAVRESLFFDIPTVASDCTYKPEGTIFHKDRDCNDFGLKSGVCFLILMENGKN